MSGRYLLNHREGFVNPLLNLCRTGDEVQGARWFVAEGEYLVSVVGVANEVRTSAMLGDSG